MGPSIVAAAARRTMKPPKRGKNPASDWRSSIVTTVAAPGPPSAAGDPTGVSRDPTGASRTSVCAERRRRAKGVPSRRWDHVRQPCASSNATKSKSARTTLPLEVIITSVKAPSSNGIRELSETRNSTFGRPSARARARAIIPADRSTPTADSAGPAALNGGQFLDESILYPSGSAVESGGEVRLPDAPGIGVEPDPHGIRELAIGVP